MKKCLLLIMLSLIIANVSSVEQVLIAEFHVNLKTKDVSLLNIKLDYGYPQKSDEFDKKAWAAILRSYDGKILHKLYFHINGFAIPLPPSNGQIAKTVHYTVREETNFALILPYISSATRLELYDDEGKLKANVSLEEFADYCGNGVCSFKENFAKCSRDCPSGSKDNYCDKQQDGICDPDCNMFSDVDCYMPMLITLSSIILGLGIAFYVLRKSKGF